VCNNCTLLGTVELRFLDVEFSELWCRVALRNNELPYATFEISGTALGTYAASFEAPDAAELALFDQDDDEHEDEEQTR